jgi:hypothetical protein
MSWVGVAIATTAISAYSTIQAGQAQKAAYKAQAKGAELEAKAQSIQEMRRLNRTLAMQNVMFAEGGRAAGEGTAQLIQLEDIEAGRENVEMIKASGATQAEGLRMAGKQAQRASLFKAATIAGTGAYQASQIK